MSDPFVCVNGIDLEAATQAIEDEIGAELRDNLGHIMRKWPNTCRNLAEVAIAAALGECIPTTVETRKSTLVGRLPHPEIRYRTKWQPVKGDQ